MKTSWLVLVLGLSACGPTITGDVTNTWGNPLPGTVVDVQGTQHQVVADERGHFKVSAELGDLALAISRTGYVTEEVEVHITDNSETRIDTVRMIKVPKTDGLKLFVDPKFVDMHPGRAYRSAWGVEHHRQGQDTCVDKDSSEANEVQAGEVRLYGSRSPEWRMWRLDEDGCAYRIVKDVDTGLWSDLHGRAVEPEARELGVDQAVFDVELEPGEYFISEWAHGEFVQIADEKYSGALRGERYAEAEDGLEWDVYSGWWVVVESRLDGVPFPGALPTR